jgi:hypothetical protein
MSDEVALANLLAGSPGTLRREIARKAREAGHLVAETPQALAELIGRPAWLEGAVAALEPPSVALLAALLWQGGALLGPAGRTPDARAAMDGLASYGLVYPVRGGWSTAQELYSPLLRLTAERMGAFRTAPGTGTAAGAEVSERGALVVAELVRLCGMLLRRHARITQQNVLYKKDALSLEAGLGPAELPDHGAWRAIAEAATRRSYVAWQLPWSSYPTRLGFLLFVLGVADALVTRGGALRMREGWRALTERGSPSLWTSLIQIGACAMADTHGAFDVLVELLRHDGWVVVRRLTRALERLPRLGPVGFGAAAEAVALFTRMLGVLGAVGATTIDGEAAVRLTPQGRASLLGEEAAPFPFDDRFYLQASGVVVTPPFLDAAVQAGLEEIADVERVDVASVYRLSQASVVRALELGWTKESILAFLGRHGGEVPQPVAASVVSWCERHRRLRFVQATLLECEDEATAEAVQALASLRAYVVGRLSPTHLILDDDSVEAVRRALERRGMKPKPDVWRPGRRPKVPAGAMPDDVLADARDAWEGPSLDILYAALRFRRRLDAKE